MTSDTLPFELSAHVRSVIDDHDPQEDIVVLADAARRSIPDDEREAVLDHLLRVYIRQAQNQRARGITQRWAENFETGGSVARPAPAVARVADPARELAFRERLMTKLATVTIHTEDGRKALPDCTAADLEFAARVREELASSQLRYAQAYRDHAKLLVEAGVEKISDLPDDLLERIYTVDA